MAYSLVFGETGTLFVCCAVVCAATDNVFKTFLDEPTVCYGGHQFQNIRRKKRKGKMSKFLLAADTLIAAVAARLFNYPVQIKLNYN